ncbi:S-adenosyl-L-methionine-dependent methyltransferase [Trichoderma afarasin]
MSWRTFRELADTITAQCDILDDFVKTRPELKQFQPSFSNYDSWQAFIDCLNLYGGPDEKDARTDLLSNTADLRDFVLGPAGTVVWPALTYPYQLSTLKILNDFSIPQIIPRDGSRTFSQITHELTENLTTKLGRKFTMSEDFVTRVIRHASTFHILAIDEGAKAVSHTAPSQAFFKNPIPSIPPIGDAYSVQSTLTICLDLRFLNTAFRIGDALLRYGDIVEPYKTAFNLAFDTPYDYLRYMVDEENFDLCETMLKHLTFVMSGHNMATRHHDQDALANNVIGKIHSKIPSKDSERENFKIMGGGWGDVCISIAKALQSKNKDKPLPIFVVKDLGRMTINGQDQLKISDLHASIKDSITFEPYDFIQEKNKEDNADIYMFRFVMHDWSDSRVITILNNIVPNMKSTARIHIMDYIIPKPDAFPLVVERLKRTMDMAAMSILAGKERTEAGWGQLIIRFNKENPNTKLGFRFCAKSEFCTDHELCTDNESCKAIKPCTHEEICNRKRAFGVVELKLASS